MDIVYIYALCDPDTRDAHYIGATTDTTRRLREHLALSSGKSNARAKWIMGLLSQDKKPVLAVLEETDDAHWRKCEQQWITKYREMNAPLKNVGNGGEGGASEARKRYLRNLSHSRPEMKPALPAYFPTYLREMIAKKARKTGMYLSQAQTARAVGVPVKTIVNWCSGQVEKLDARDLAAFMKYFNCRMNDLIGLPKVYEDIEQEINRDTHQSGRV